MYGEKLLIHGRELVELLQDSNATPTKISTILPRKVNGYIRQAYCFFYEHPIDTGIVLIEWEIKPKNKYQNQGPNEPAIYHSLSAVNLSDLITNYSDSAKNKLESPDYDNIAKRAIDKMIKQRVAGIPPLLTPDYVIAEGDDAVSMYNTIHHNLGTNSPKANELASIITQYERKPLEREPVQRHSANPETLFPDSQTRISLGIS